MRLWGLCKLEVAVCHVSCFEYCTTMVGGLCTIVVSHAKSHVGSVASSLMFVCLFVWPVYGLLISDAQVSNPLDF